MKIYLSLVVIWAVAFSSAGAEDSSISILRDVYNSWSTSLRTDETTARKHDKNDFWHYSGNYVAIASTVYFFATLIQQLVLTQTAINGKRKRDVTSNDQLVAEVASNIQQAMEKFAQMSLRE